MKRTIPHGCKAVPAIWLLAVVCPWHSGAANLLVYNTNDSGAGSLREAISNNAAMGGGSTILFSNIVTGTITLTAGELLISNNVTILGPGASVLAVSGNSASRVFHIADSTASLSGLTISNGAVKAAFGADATGGGILNSGTLTLSNCVVTRNSAIAGDGAPAGTGYGGGIWSSGTLTLTGCTMNGNSVSGGAGGAYNAFQAANGGDAAGGGLCNSAGLLIANGCTFNNNSARGGLGGYAGGFGGIGGNAQGGGIVNTNGGVLLLTNCTFNMDFCESGAGGGSSQNDGAARGGALCMISGSSILEHCTVSGNQLLTGSGANPYPDLAGGGICNSYGAVTIHNTIAAGNLAFVQEPAISSSDVSGSFTSLGFNLVGQPYGSSGWISSDYTGTFASPLDPMLGPLAANGGTTSTMIPKPGSPAIDHGTAGGAVTDQRGQGRPFDFALPANAVGGDGSDIGAVEVYPNWVVTNTNDSGTGSLRQAILDASSINDDIISFSPGVTGTILLTGGELLINKSLWISGPGAGVLAVSGNGASRVFEVTNGWIIISGLTIRDGTVVGATFTPSGVGGGGVLCNQSALLSLTDCVISNCAAIGSAGVGSIYGNGGIAGNASGGGIFNQGGLAVVRCWIVHNQAAGGHGGQGGSGILPGYGGNGGIGGGGGIYSASQSNIVFSSSTISGNTAIFGAAGGGGLGPGTNGTAYGGGLFSYSSASIQAVNCTVASNVVNGAGTGIYGGIYSSSGGVGLLSCTIVGNNGDGSSGGVGGPAGHSVTNTIIAWNSAASSPDVAGTFTSGGYNLVGNTSGSTGFGATADQLNVDPMLGPLQNNGGPTPTMAPIAGSPAIDQGKSFGLTTDQRGALRPFDFSSLSNASGGDGSDIGAFELGQPTLSIQQAGNAAVLSWPSYYGYFTLQSSTNVASSNAWITAAGSAVIVGNQYQQTNSPISGNQFFRLYRN